MPAIVTGTTTATTTGPAQPQRSEQMWQALKAHILKERQRKKQEQEADAEEERQRKERETQQKQNVMTLGETREQISSLESELTQLKNEKHQLFVTLKKVLHEDDSRRRLIKETCVMPEPLMGPYIGPDPGSVVHPHLYLPLPTRSPLYKVTAATPPHTLLPSGPLKRSHSPSPPPPPPVSSYHPGYGYKPPPTIPSYIPTPSKSEEAARRSGDSRVVLWNKSPNQFPGSSYYAPPGQYDFGPPPTSQPLPRVPEPGKTVYLTATRGPMPSMQTAPYAEDKFYQRPGTHVAVHGGAIPIQQPPQGAKTGGITTGYPVRAPQAPPQGPYPPPPPGTYVSVAGPNVPGRRLFTQPGLHYLQRDV